MLFGDYSKDLIFSILLENYAISAKEVYMKFSKRSIKQISYQAVHKQLSELCGQGVLLKMNGKYLIDPKWPKKLSSTLERVSRIIESKNKGSILEDKVIFNTIYEVDVFLINLCKSLNPKSNEEVFQQWIHFWLPLFFEKSKYKEMKELLAQTNFYSITPNNSPIDIWCAKFWKQLGVNEKLNVTIGANLNFLVYRDFIVQVFYPLEIQKLLDEVYNSTNNPSKLNIDNFFKTVFEKKTRIPVLVSRNKEVADELKGMIKSFF